MFDLNPPPLRPVKWLGNSRKAIQAFPNVVQKLIGDELQLIQYGETPKDTKQFRGVGSGILEIAVRYDKNAYRAVLAVQLAQSIYVLHAFQKKSKRGIQTPKLDIEMIQQRYKEAKELAKHETD
ncbi:MAG: hypothetical protein NPIRA01_20040 [Nitrospirales bacterium]|nr:MAG: hypothetical protein NPIRA01_20040 [Nitrospirales bacterium]